MDARRNLHSFRLWKEVGWTVPQDCETELFNTRAGLSHFIGRFLKWKSLKDCKVPSSFVQAVYTSQRWGLLT
ncbi:unnamed protein product [Allacma fusca]|uniref:Uncharacterized protein n=1 Tax=Allacma fusca TaxID=39272 RepID=A0A8J2LNB7_9HEXA|nr:unnamed protein product [Allacma fusca]